MTSSSFDLNIQNYSNEELEYLLGLQKSYSVNDIMSNKQNLSIQLASIPSSIQVQSQLNEFLDAASKCLISHFTATREKKNKENDNENKKMSFSENPLHNNKIISESIPDGHFVISESSRIPPLETYGALSGIRVGQGAPPGLINPIKVSTIISTVSVDSRFRKNYFNTKSTDYFVDLPDKIKNIVAYRVGAIEIPFFALYGVSELNGNNAIKIIWGYEDENDGSYSYPESLVIVIPDGNYYTTPDALSQQGIDYKINLILESNTITSDSNPGLAGVLVYHIDLVSGKSVFAQPFGARAIYYKIIVNVRSNGELNYDAPLTSFLGWNLGFRNAEYISNNNGNNHYGSVVSEGLAAFKSTSYIFIVIDDFNTSVNDYYSPLFAESYTLKNVIARVNVGLVREIIEGSSTQLNRQRNFFGPVNIRRLRLTLYDDMGRVLNLNNMDWNLELIFECVYD